MNVGRVLDPALAAVPDRTALICGDEVRTYAELEADVHRVACVLDQAGVGEGDRVALVANAGVLSVATILACARLGAASAQMNVELTPGELRQLTASVGARAGVAAEGFRSRLVTAMGDDVVLGQTDVEAASGPPLSDIGVGGGDLPALILFTSGTTGLPKPIHISHGVIADRLAFYAGPIDPDVPPAISMLSVPIFHVGGTLGVFIGLGSGATQVMLPRFGAAAWLDAVERHAVRRTFVVPTMLQRILDHPEFDPKRLEALEQLSYGAAAAPVSLVERALDALPWVAFSNVFGQTETLGAYAMLGPDDHRARRKLGSAGKVFPGVEIRIVDPETDLELGTGETGEVVIRAEQNVTSDWLRTGDLAWLDSEDYLHPVDRIADTINRGGEKFGRSEIEDVLRRHPQVRDVGVAPIPDEELGERVGALVVVEGEIDPEQLREFSEGHLARFKIPELFLFVDDLPYNNLGKLSRRALVEAFEVAQKGDGQ